MFKIKSWEEVKPYETVGWLTFANRALIRYFGAMIVNTKLPELGVLSIEGQENGITSVVTIGNLDTGEVSHKWEINQGSILDRVLLIENEQK